MSAIIDSLAPHRWTTVRTGAMVGTIQQRPTSGVAAGLREIAAEQAQMLRDAFGSRNLPATAKTRRADAARERLAEHRARTAEVAAPARSLRDIRPNADGSTPAIPYALLDSAAAEIGEGYFALQRAAASSAGNTLTFFAIMPMRGKGTLRIRQLLGGPGGWQYRNLSVKEQFHALRHILTDTQAARMLFAAKTERCYMCKSPLTNDESRRLGIGPDCRTK